jgi:hypothetical protein
MKKTILLVLLSLSLTLFLDGCKKENMCDCIKSTGSDIRSDRDASPFHFISLEGKIDLVLTQDTTERIYVVSGRHLIDNIETTITAETLYIRNHNICNFVRSYGRHITVYASVKFLRELLYKGAGDVTCTNTLVGLTGSDTIIGAESFEGSGSIVLNINAKASNLAVHTGPADIRLIGTVHNLYLYAAGNGVIHTDDVPGENIYVENGGTADMYIRSSTSSTSFLQAHVYGTGNLYCKGTPSTINRNLSGTGQLIFQ